MRTLHQVCRAGEAGTPNCSVAAICAVHSSIVESPESGDMAEVKESLEQKITRLETELARAKRMEEAAQLALMFVHEGRKKISMASNFVWLAKSETEKMTSVTRHLTEVEKILEFFGNYAERILAVQRLKRQDDEG